MDIPPPTSGSLPGMPATSNASSNALMRNLSLDTAIKTEPLPDVQHQTEHGCLYNNTLGKLGYVCSLLFYYVLPETPRKAVAFLTAVLLGALQLLLILALLVFLTAVYYSSNGTEVLATSALPGASCQPQLLAPSATVLMDTAGAWPTQQSFVPSKALYQAVFAAYNRTEDQLVSDVIVLQHRLQRELLDKLHSQPFSSMLQALGYANASLQLPGGGSVTLSTSFQPHSPVARPFHVFERAINLTAFVDGAKGAELWDPERSFQMTRTPDAGCVRGADSYDIGVDVLRVQGGLATSTCDRDHFTFTRCSSSSSSSSSSSAEGTWIKATQDDIICEGSGSGFNVDTQFWALRTFDSLAAATAGSCRLVKPAHLDWRSPPWFPILAKNGDDSLRALQWDVAQVVALDYCNSQRASCLARLGAASAADVASGKLLMQLGCSEAMPSSYSPALDMLGYIWAVNDPQELNMDEGTRKSVVDVDKYARRFFVVPQLAHAQQRTNCMACGNVTTAAQRAACQANLHVMLHFYWLSQQAAEAADAAVGTEPPEYFYTYRYEMIIGSSLNDHGTAVLHCSDLAPLYFANLPAVPAATLSSYAANSSSQGALFTGASVGRAAPFTLETGVFKCMLPGKSFLERVGLAMGNVSLLYVVLSVVLTSSVITVLGWRKHDEVGGGGDVSGKGTFVGDVQRAKGDQAV